MSFRKKAEFILAEQPDILIVPECEHPDKLLFKNEIAKPTDTLWFGQNPNKGLAVLSYCDLKIKLLDIHNAEFKYVLPLSVYNDKINLTIFAVWTQKPERHDCYTEQVWNAVHFYDNLLSNENVILAGDFNSSSIWDKPNRIYNHTNLVNLLKNKNILSTYHHFHNQKQGVEKDKTLFMHRKIDKPYHIDFCFASMNLIDKLKNVEIGAYETWTKHSDHKPLAVTLDL